MGDGDGEEFLIRFLNRSIRCTDSGLLIESGMVIKDLDFVGGRAGRLPGSKEDMKRPHKARELINDAKNIENSGTDAIDQCGGLFT